ncbi:MAG: translation initiation factor IF-2 [Clostridia bacterium]|nr:translation initiation factor IF-2 [Clostridia bacterium]
MNKTENKTQVDFSNIREMQNLIKSNSVSNLAGELKSFKQRLSVVGGKILEIKKANEKAEVKAPAKTEVKETAPVEEPAKAPAKPAEQPARQERPQQMARPAAQAQGQRPQYGNNGYQNGSYNRNGQSGQRQGGNNFQGNRQGGNGRFTPTGERRFDNGRDYSGRQGSFGNNGGQFNRSGNAQGQNGGFGKKPFGNNAGSSTGFAPRLPRPTESFDASSLAKNNNRTATKKKSYEKNGDEKKSLNKKALLMRGYVDEENGMDDESMTTVRRYSKKTKEEAAPVKPVIKKIEHAVITTDNLTVKILAETIGKSVPELMGKFLLLGMMVNINSNIDYESAELVASEFGITLEKQVEKTFEEKLAESYSSVVDNEADLVKRPAIVTVMGHVDHGKTSLLDKIRKTNVVEGEAGGITQSIGAYTIKLNGEEITFIDTPGHAAFTAMRERGAKLTDIAILIVAADDGVMPQTIECIHQIKQINVPMIVAISKIDKPGANIDNVKTQLATHDVLPEEWGGDAIIVPIDAKHGENIDKLLEMVLFVAEYQNLKANPKRKAQGSIIEARLDKGLGAVASVLVQNGTLNVGDYVVVGTCTGKIRAMMNDKNERVKSAGPSIAVQIMGLSGVPNAGDELFVVDEKMSRQVALERQNTAKVEMIKSADLSIENMMNKIADSNFKDFNVIVKADVQGSVEALRASLSELQNEEVKVRFVSGGVGAINENDVSLAQAANALIVAFNTKTDFKAKVLADKYKVEIKNSKVIYEVIDYITEKINKMVAPKYKEVVTGHAEIRATFKASKVGLIAGTYVLDGRISRGSKVRVMRGEKKIFEGEISTIQREKNEAKDVDAGYECGVTFAGFTDFIVGDTFETYSLERIN